MVGIKRLILPMTTVAALAFLPVSSALAFGPLLVLPWLLGHPLAAMAAAVTIPAVENSQQGYYAGAPYPAAPAYAPAYSYNYAPPAAYARPPLGYAPAYNPAPWGYARAPSPYGVPSPRGYAPAYGYYAPSARYYGAYGGHFSNYSRGSGYRRR
jgi:hypothetical protein